MLTNLHIENYALIQQSDLSLQQGFVAITGETGAGKSVMLGALGLLLGQRADTQVLADKERKCVVEATFDIAGLGLEKLFADNDFDYDDQLILRREILPSAKSRGFINDSPASLQQMKEIGSRLVDIHSQHETLTLADSHFQIALLDNLAANGDSILSAYQSAYREYTALKKQLEQLTAEDAQNKRDIDYMQFQFNELQNAQLKEGEQEDLEQESQLLSHVEGIKQGLQTALSLNEGDELSTLHQLSSAVNALSRISSYHAGIGELHQRMDSCVIELRDILDELARIDDQLQFSSELQQQVADRLDLIYRLQQKHGVQSVSELIQVREELDAKLCRMGNMDAQIRDTMEQVDRAFRTMQAAAQRLTAQRKQSAARLEQQILGTLSALGMPNARLKVQVSAADSCHLNGNDHVVFLFNANKGGEYRELGKVISGGELSRLMLAIKSMATQHRLLPTIIFDEIDSGVSGDISVAVGNIMRQMSQRMQVIAITHLPQIAAQAGQHLKVYKSEGADGNTHSQVRQLSAEEKINEIAVMLSSDPPTAAALQTARELSNSL